MNTAALRLTIKQWAPEDRPTERLQRLGAESLTDGELLAILIGSGTQQYSAVDIANNVLGKFNRNLNTLGKARFDEILDTEGVGTQTACKILAAVELGRRRQMATPELHPDMSTATRIYNYMLPKMQDLATEEFHILLMNQNYGGMQAHAHPLPRPCYRDRRSIYELQGAGQTIINRNIHINKQEENEYKGLFEGAGSHPYPLPQR